MIKGLPSISFIRIVITYSHLSVFSQNFSNFLVLLSIDKSFFFLQLFSNFFAREKNGGEKYVKYFSLPPVFQHLRST